MKFNSIAQSSLVVLSVLLAPVYSFAAEAPYCIAVNGGFGTSGGTTFVARNFTLPTEGKCSPWSGYTKTGALTPTQATEPDALAEYLRGRGVSSISPAQGKGGW